MIKKDRYTMKCWFCRGEMKWTGDYDFNEFGFDGDGFIATLSCSECESLAEFYTKPINEKILNDQKN